MFSRLISAWDSFIRRDVFVRRVSGHWHEQQSDLEETSFFSLVCHGATPSGTPHTHIDPSLLCKEHFLVDESPRFPLHLRFQLAYFLCRPLSTPLDRSSFSRNVAAYERKFNTRPLFKRWQFSLSLIFRQVHRSLHFSRLNFLARGVTSTVRYSKCRPRKCERLTYYAIVQTCRAQSLCRKTINGRGIS